MIYFTRKKLSDTIVNALQKVETRYDEKAKKWLVQAIPQMERSDYNTFKKILGEIDGKWSKKLDAHVFSCDPTIRIQEIISVGCLPERKPHDAFFTPSIVTEELLEWGDFYFFDDPGFYKCLEPQAGQGNIVEVLRQKYPKIQIDCCEIDEVNCAALKRKNFKVIAENFLSLPTNPIYRWVIMNPPFNGRQGDYIDHISHAFNFLKENGRLLAIVPESFLNSEIPRIIDFRNWVFTYGSHAKLPKKSFAESGTTIDCTMLKIDKFSDEQIKEFESLGYPHECDIYTDPILVSLESESKWEKQSRQLVHRIQEGRIDSKEKLLNEFIRCANPIVQDCIYKLESDLRWDNFTKHRVAEYFYEQMIENHFNNKSPFG